MDRDYKSRTRKKNEDRGLQRLGEQLVALPFGHLETMELQGPVFIFFPGSAFIIRIHFAVFPLAVYATSVPVKIFLRLRARVLPTAERTSPQFS